ncbi:MAG: HAD family hydrolase [Chloroflexi bacterium]|nr:MAG: HAD family hydrolase [Chloroflexota bacterium]
MAETGETAWPLRSSGTPPLRTVFFDLGDTLMHVHPDVPTLYRQTCAELGVEADAAAIAVALSAGEHLYRDALRSGRTFECSMSDARAFWQEYNEMILTHLGVDRRRAELAQALSERFWEPHSWRVFPEVHGVLSALRESGLRLAVISNFTDALLAVCETHELAGYFECLVASASTGSQKPDAGIFREALHRTGADPETSLHVGDNYVADVLGARGSGIDGVLVDRTRAGGAGMFDFTLRPGLGGSRGVRLDCPVIADLRPLTALAAR